MHNYITRGMCFPGRGISPVISVSWVQEHISLGIIPRQGKHISLGICVQGNTYHGQKHVNHARIWTAFVAFIYGDKFNNGTVSQHYSININSAP